RRQRYKRPPGRRKGGGSSPALIHLRIVAFATSSSVASCSILTKRLGVVTGWGGKCVSDTRVSCSLQPGARRLPLTMRRTKWYNVSAAILLQGFGTGRPLFSLHRDGRSP